MNCNQENLVMFDIMNILAFLIERRVVEVETARARSAGEALWWEDRWKKAVVRKSPRAMQ